MQVLASSTTVVAALLAMAGGHLAALHQGGQSTHPAEHSACHPVTVTVAKTIGLPGVGGHGDVVRSDPGARSVYISQSPDNNVVVINTRTNSIRAVVPGVIDANGIDYGPRYVFVAEASAGKVAVISKATWRVVASVPSGGAAPDAVYYDSRDRSVFVGNVDSGNMEEFSATAPFSIRGALRLGPANPKAGEDLGTYVRRTDRIYQSVDNTVAVINAHTRTVEKVYTLPVPASESSKDIYYDRWHHVLWVATTAAEVLAVNPETGVVEATVKTASGIDEVTGDPGRNLLFLGEGKAGVMGVVDMNSKKNIMNIPTESGFHTLAYQRGSGNVYAYLNYANKVTVYDVDRAHSWRG
ncbi:MAG: YncE family protein [Sciscionella sp.]